MNKTPGFVDLMNHLRRILNQITVPFLEKTDFFHLRIQLRKRLFQVDRHFIKGIGKRFNFIAGLQHEGMIPIPRVDSLHAFMQGLNRAHDFSSHDKSCQPQNAQHHDAIHRHLHQQLLQGGIGLLGILPNNRQPLSAPKTFRSQRFRNP